MRNQSRDDRVIAIIKLADHPLTLGEIRRIYPDQIERSELSCILGRLVQRGDIYRLSIPRPEHIMTGPAMVSAYHVSESVGVQSTLFKCN